MKKRRNYKGVPVNAIGIPIFNLQKKPVARFPKNKNKSLYNYSFSSPFDKKHPKNLIVMYDIPHEFKKERDWLRRHLVKFEYVMIQKSVWVGPSPLPKEFLIYLKEINIGNNLKTFKLSKPFNS
jgi:DNA-binding transcriptional regulator PaaX